jgi:hypothetical protein
MLSPARGSEAESLEAYGYVRDNDSKFIVPEPVQAVVVRRIFDLYVTGRKGIKSIANILNAEGFAIKNGMPFAHPIVHAILSNPIYGGRVHFRGQEFTGLYEALVDEETFERAQALLAERSASHALRRETRATTFCPGRALRAVRARVHRHLGKGQKRALPLLHVLDALSLRDQGVRRRAPAESRA